MSKNDSEKKTSEDEKVEATPFIKGEFIDLCPKNSKLSKTYMKWKNDPRVRKYARNVTPRTLDEEKKRREESPGRFSTQISLDIWHKEDNKPIGEIGLGHINWINGWANTYAQIGEPEYWNKNIATEATELLVEYAFNELNLHKLHGGVAVKNIGSWSVAEKIGFKLEGIEKEDFYIDGEYVDSKRYCLLKEDWLKRKRLK